MRRYNSSILLRTEPWEISNSSLISCKKSKNKNIYYDNSSTSSNDLKKSSISLSSTSRLYLNILFVFLVSFILIFGILVSQNKDKETKKIISFLYVKNQSNQSIYGLTTKNLFLDNTFSFKVTNKAVLTSAMIPSDYTIYSESFKNLTVFNNETDFTKINKFSSIYFKTSNIFHSTRNVTNLVKQNDEKPILAENTSKLTKDFITDSLSFTNSSQITQNHYLTKNTKNSFITTNKSDSNKFTTKYFLKQDEKSASVENTSKLTKDFITDSLSFTNSSQITQNHYLTKNTTNSFITTIKFTTKYLKTTPKIFNYSPIIISSQFSDKFTSATPKITTYFKLNHNDKISSEAKKIYSNTKNIIISTQTKEIGKSTMIVIGNTTGSIKNTKISNIITNFTNKTTKNFINIHLNDSIRSSDYDYDCANNKNRQSFALIEKRGNVDGFALFIKLDELITSYVFENPFKINDYIIRPEYSDIEPLRLNSMNTYKISSIEKLETNFSIIKIKDFQVIQSSRKIVPICTLNRNIFLVNQSIKLYDLRIELMNKDAKSYRLSDKLIGEIVLSHKMMSPKPCFLDLFEIDIEYKNKKEYFCFYNGKNGILSNDKVYYQNFSGRVVYGMVIINKKFFFLGSLINKANNRSEFAFFFRQNRTNTLKYS